jgi:hypothetical protein
MIKNILELLALQEHYRQSEAIEIAKGKYKLVTSWKQGFEQVKRLWKIR